MFFFLKFFEDISPFCGATDTPVFGLLVTSSLGFKAIGWIPCFCALSPTCNEFLRFTSDVTPADCVEVSKATQPFFHPCTCKRVHKHWWRFGARTHDRPCRTQQARAVDTRPLRLGLCACVLCCVKRFLDVILIQKHFITMPFVEFFHNRAENLMILAQIIC